MNFKPLLAKDADLNCIEYGNVWVSPKLDGIRAIVMGGVVYSRKLKPIPNLHVQKLFGHLEHYDGELIVGPPNAKDVYNVTYSGVMSVDGAPQVDFYTFDHIERPDDDYEIRYRRLEHGVLVYQTPVRDLEDLLRVESHWLEQGYEGVMIRKIRGPQSKYKFGRSTPKEGTLLKLKRFSDKEAVIVGVEEEMRNDNEATVDALGHTKRSSHQENKVGKGRLGALVCELEGVRFKIGTGYTAAMREKLWAQREDLPGQLVTFKSFDIGVIDAPRFPVFKGLRSPLDV